ncbi:MAG: alkaline phosphatase D family protein, partial [Myxococcota bacterium]
LGGGAHPPLVFEQGVASGEVTPWSAVLWTRVSQETAVKVEVFTDPDLKPPKVFQATGDSDGTRLEGVPFFNDFEVLDAVRGEDADFFIYLGDQIYSDSFVRGLRGQGPAMTLDEYRDVWKENLSIPALPDLLASTSILAIWDDHEVQNDYDGQTVDPARYANGRQAYFEYLPSEESGLLRDPSCAGEERAL